ncbi:SHOCT domain-containing protein [Enterobacter sichuanensis]
MHEAIVAGREVKTKTPAAEPAVAHLDPYEQLKKLSGLKESGIISEEEFQAKKKQINGADLTSLPRVNSGA